MKKTALVMGMLLIAAILAFVSGCKQGSAPDSDELVELTWLVWNREIIPPEQGTLTDNWWTRYVDEQVAPLGAKIKYVIIPRGQEEELISTMLAAGNAPTFSYTYDLNLIKTYINGGGIADISTLVDEYGTDIKNFYNNSPGGLDDFKIGGKLYYLAYLNNWIDPKTTYIRTDWLNAVGMSAPSTADEFYEVLKAIKAKDPGKAGSALVPFALEGGTGYWESEVLPGFVKTPPALERFLTPLPMWPETKDCFRWLNKLYNEGLMSDEFLVDDGNLFKQKIVRGEIFAYCWSGHHPYYPGYGDLYKTLKQNTPAAVISSIDTFKQSNAPWAGFSPEKNPTYEYYWFIPSSEKNLEIAVKVLNWMATPACRDVSTNGIEGVDYILKDGVVTPIDQAAFDSKVGFVNAQYNSLGVPSVYFSSDRNVTILNSIVGFDPMFKDQLLKEARLSSEYKYYKPSIPGLTPIGDKLNPALEEYWEEEYPKLIYGPASGFDARFDAVVKTYREMGGDQVAAEALDIYRTK
ncbi:MAG: extracellular solute-binding protein [Treponema sp.]|jgi:putative aldouronate transport system substrate-binding protein|nr:extracellular solute-binding protein [Treponema sp.]